MRLAALIDLGTLPSSFSDLLSLATLDVGVNNLTGAFR